VITVDADIAGNIERTHYALVPSRHFSFSPDLNESAELLRRDWAHLEPDPYMADGGSYRSRRYGLYRLSATTGQLTHIPGAPFYQSIEVNPLNGGEQRHFAALGANTVENPFLHELILFDFAQLTSKEHIEDDWLIGVHQIRIITTPGVPGNPTPEGTHRDDESYTSQHLISRQNIGGGVNYFYGYSPEPTGVPQAVWKQKSYFDSYYFDSSLWHSVSPIVSGKRDDGGHRDVLLIDFVKPSKSN
jgi:hypothetical protein